jgi:hypothetical protein
MSRESVRILFIGDIVGKPGRRVLARHLATVRERLKIDFVIANAENAAGGAGVTLEVVNELTALGVDCITTGNHVWNKREILPHLDSIPSLLRPANYPPGNPGHGLFTGTLPSGFPIAVLNLTGRTFMGGQHYDCPFRTADELLAGLAEPARIVFVDFHAEATAEKVGLGLHLDGRVTAVAGTHTHVATADEQILPRGTAYITDVGMTGPVNSVIGVIPGLAIERLLLQRPVKFDVASGPARINAVYVEADPASGLALAIRRISVDED